MPTRFEWMMICGIVLFGVCAFLFIDLEIAALDLANPNHTQEQLEGMFREWAYASVAAATICAFGWFVASKLWTPANPRSLGLRGAWIGAFIVVAIVGIVSVSPVAIPSGTYGVGLWILFNSVNSIGIFWVATMAFSPSATKFTAPFSRAIRRW